MACDKLIPEHFGLSVTEAENVLKVINDVFDEVADENGVIDGCGAFKLVEKIYGIDNSLKCLAFFLFGKLIEHESMHILHNIPPCKGGITLSEGGKDDA